MVVEYGALLKMPQIVVLGRDSILAGQPLPRLTKEQHSISRDSLGLDNLICKGGESQSEDLAIGEAKFVHVQ